MTLTPEQLQLVAERLGWQSMEDRSGNYGPHIRVHRRWRACEREGCHESHSDGELLLAILERAAQMSIGGQQCRPFLSPNLPGEKWRWDCEISNYTPQSGAGEVAVLGQGDTPLAAAILAFIQLPTGATR